MMESRTRWAMLGLTLAGLGLTGTGVGAQQQARLATPDEVGVADPVEITIDNRNWADMRIYALRHGKRHRLGLVRSFTSEAFRLPPQILTAVTEVQLLAEPIGASPSVLSPVVLVNPGDELVWELRHDLSLSGTPIG